VTIEGEGNEGMVAAASSFVNIMIVILLVMTGFINFNQTQTPNVLRILEDKGGRRKKRRRRREL